jgi:hypothetical protein
MSSSNIGKLKKIIQSNIIGNQEHSPSLSPPRCITNYDTPIKQITSSSPKNLRIKRSAKSTISVPDHSFNTSASVKESIKDDLSLKKAYTGDNVSDILHLKKTKTLNYSSLNYSKSVKSSITTIQEENKYEVIDNFEP